MRAVAKYSTPTLAGLTAFAVACSDAVAPEMDRLSLQSAVSASAGKKSGAPPPDVTAPATPGVSGTDVGRRHISLAWSSTDASTSALYYSITVNGLPDPNGGTWERSRTYYMLQPATTYTFTVRARDYAGNLSPPSAPLAVTTKPLDPSDTQPPSGPTNVLASDFGSGDREFQVTWTASIDNADAQADQHYEVHVNGELSDVVAGKTQSSNYGNSGTNTISVIAVDANGNKSAPGITTILFIKQ